MPNPPSSSSSPSPPSKIASLWNSRPVRIVLVLVAAVVVALAVFLLWFKLTFGGPTEDFPEVLVGEAAVPRLPTEALEKVATLEEAPGNLAVSPDGRLFFNYHPEGRPSVQLVEWVDGRAVPWPSERWQSDPGDGSPYFDTVFSLRIDRQGRLWTVDPGFHGLRQPRLLAFDLATGELVHRHDFADDIAPLGSYVQDLQVSPDGSTVFLADIGVMNRRPALLAHDVETNTTRRLLEGHRSVRDKPYRIEAPTRDMVLLGGLFKMHPAVDSIVLDERGEWLYYGAMAHENLFRAPAVALADPTLTPEQLEATVETYSPKPQSDGLAMDREDRIYVTAIEHGAIALIEPDRSVSTLVDHPGLRWPDGLSFGPDGWLYVTDSAIPDLMMRSKSHMREAAPYFIWRVRAPAGGTPGH